MKIAITGASGMIGRRLLKTLAAGGHTVQVLSRHAGTNMPAGVKVFAWDAGKGEPPAESLEGCDAVIHLAGEPVAQRWTAEAKRRIRESRVEGTRNLVRGLAKLQARPAALIASSAIGYYGSRGDEVLTENAPAGTGFLPEVCVEWEREAVAAEALGVRVARVRTGVVLDARGGALARLLPPFKIGVGGPIGSGRQWMSWIHLDDLAGLYGWAVEQPVSGAVNGVAPNPVTNAEFAKRLGAALHRPALFPMPAAVLRLVFGEMAEVLLASQRVEARAAAQSGFSFRFPQLEGALADLL